VAVLRPRRVRRPRESAGNRVRGRQTSSVQSMFAAPRGAGGAVGCTPASGGGMPSTPGNGRSSTLAALRIAADTGGPRRGSSGRMSVSPSLIPSRVVERRGPSLRRTSRQNDPTRNPRRSGPRASALPRAPRTSIGSDERMARRRVARREARTSCPGADVANPSRGTRRRQYRRCRSSGSARGRMRSGRAKVRPLERNLVSPCARAVRSTRPRGASRTRKPPR